MATAEIRHPRSRVLLQEVRRLITGEVLRTDDWYPSEDGTWRKCPESRVGTRVEQRELDCRTVWARPTTPEPVLAARRTAVVHASMGMMLRLRW